MLRVAILSTTLVGLVIYRAIDLWPKPDGCPIYTPVQNKILIAHAGGGLPTATYSNTPEAMDLAVQHGFKFIEIDFWKQGEQIWLSHDKPRGGEAEAQVLLDWMSRNPDIFLVTDFKTDNLSGLTSLVHRAGDMKSRIIPQIYNPSEYDAILKLGMHKPILTLYRVTEPWEDFANSTDLWAVTFPEDKRHWAKGINKPILIHTINRPTSYAVSGFYTDCLIPAGPHQF